MLPLSRLDDLVYSSYGSMPGVALEVGVFGNDDKRVRLDDNDNNNNDNESQTKPQHHHLVLLHRAFFPPPPPAAAAPGLLVLLHAARLVLLDNGEDGSSSSDDDNDKDDDINHAAPNRHSQSRRTSIRARLERHIAYVRGVFRQQHEIAARRTSPPLVCQQSESKYWRLTPLQAHRFALPGIHGLRKPQQRFAVAWKSVVISQRLLDATATEDEASVCAEFTDPRDASAVSQQLRVLFE